MPVFFAALSIFLILVTTAAAQQTPDKTDKQAGSATTDGQQLYGDWKITCEDGQKCRMAQSVVNQTTGKPVVQLRIYREKSSSTALFSFPLGILLNTGWQFRVDNGKINLLPFEICREDGCHAGINLTKQLLSGMQKGNFLNVTIRDSNQKPVNIKLSLKGFSKAYEALKQ